MKAYSVYPGEYIPLPEVEALLQELKIPSSEVAARPLINMDELKDCYRLEVSMPGVRREDIFVHVHNGTLYIAVMHKKSEALKKKGKMHEFNTTCLERSIPLPRNANAEFVSAEYHDGILCLHIRKAGKPVKSGTLQIVVY